MKYIYACGIFLFVNFIISTTYAAEGGLRLNIKSNDIEVVFADKINLELDVGFFTSDISIGGTNLPYPNGTMYLNKINNCQHGCELKIFLYPTNSRMVHKELYGVINFNLIQHPEDSVVKTPKGETKTIKFEISKYIYSWYGVKYPGTYSGYIEMQGNKSNTLNIKLKEDGAINLLVENLLNDELQIWASDRLKDLTWFDLSEEGQYYEQLSNETICGWQKWLKENKGRFFWNEDELRFNLR